LVRFVQLVPPAVADISLAPLEKHFFEKYAMVAHETDIPRLRREKF